MALQGRPRRHDEWFGPRLLTLANLKEIESKWPSETSPSIEAGPYKADSIDDLADSSLLSLPNLTMSGSGLWVWVTSRSANVASFREDPSTNAAAESIAVVLRATPRKWTIVETPTRLAVLLGMWICIAMFVVGQGLVWVSYQETRSTTDLAVYAIGLSLGGLTGYFGPQVVTRLPGLDPIRLSDEAPEPWLRRNAPVLSVAVTALGIVVSATVIVLTRQ